MPYLVIIARLARYIKVFMMLRTTCSPSVSRPGIGPGTYSLRGNCSTN